MQRFRGGIGPKAPLDRLTVSIARRAFALLLFAMPMMAGAATFTVRNTADAGPDSLRQALLDGAASTTTADTIAFAIPGNGVHRIFPLSELPPLRDALDGYTQPGASPNTVASGETNAVILVEISGDNAGDARGLVCDSNYCRVRGVAVNGFRREGVAMMMGGFLGGTFIGTDSSGMLANPNAEGVVANGICVTHLIGGPAPADRNVLSGNIGAGVRFDFYPSCLLYDAQANGNLIGTDATSRRPLPNGTGLEVFGGKVLVGGGNVIAFNVGAGVLGDSTAEEIFGNSIHDNGGLGIDHGAPGPTPNDPLDNVQNWPVIESAVALPNETVISGRLESTGELSGEPFGYWIEVFANNTCDPSGFGEGRETLGADGVASSPTGVMTWTVRVPRRVSGSLTATATGRRYGGDWIDPANTSEFSPCFPVQLVATTEVPALEPAGLAVLAALLAVIGLRRLRASAGA